MSRSAAPAGADDAGDRAVEDLLLVDHGADPADRVVSDERVDALRGAIGDLLSGLEVDVLRLYVEGKSYQEIGEQLGRHVKSIDNALQRIKRKLDRHLAADAELSWWPSDLRFRAGCGDRTHDILFTREVLCQLS